MSSRMTSERPSSKNREPGDLDDRIGEKANLRSVEGAAGDQAFASGGNPGGGSTAPPAGVCGPKSANRSKTLPPEVVIAAAIGRGNGEPNPTADNLEFGGYRWKNPEGT